MSEWPKEHDWKSCMSRKGHRGFESLSLRHESVKVKNKNMFKKIAWFYCLVLSAVIMYADEPFVMPKHPSVQAIAQSKDSQEEIDTQDSAHNKMINFIDYVAPVLGFINGYSWKYVKNEVHPYTAQGVYAGSTLVAIFGIPLLVTASKPSPQITDDLTLRAIRKIYEDRSKECGRQFLIYGTGVAVGAFVQSFVSL